MIKVVLLNLVSADFQKFVEVRSISVLVTGQKVLKGRGDVVIFGKSWLRFANFVS